MRGFCVTAGYLSAERCAVRLFLARLGQQLPRHLQKWFENVVRQTGHAALFTAALPNSPCSAKLNFHAMPAVPHRYSPASRVTFAITWLSRPNRPKIGIMILDLASPTPQGVLLSVSRGLSLTIGRRSTLSSPYSMDRSAAQNSATIHNNLPTSRISPAACGKI